MTDKLLTIFFAVCSTVALFADVESTGNLSMALNGTGIVQLTEFCVLYYCYNRFLINEKELIRQTDKREQVVYGVLSVLFSIFMIIGKAQHAEENLKYSIMAVVLLLGYIPFFGMILLKISKLITENINKTQNSKVSSLTEFIFEKHSILAPMCCVLICRIPYWIAFFPCSMTWDGGAQISSYYGREAFNDHHPPLISFFYGATAWYSNEWGIPNVGMFCIVVLQSLLTAYAVAQVCLLMKKLMAPYWLRWCTLGYFSLFTVWNIFDVTIIKDSLYYPLTMLFTVKIVECLWNIDEFFAKKGNLILYVIYAILMSQVRNNGIFVVMFVTPFIVGAIWHRKKMNAVKNFAIMSFIAFLAVYLLKNVCYPKLGVVQLEAKVDTYCILFQQTAKYAKEHPEDVTETERQVLDQLFVYDELGESYEPRLADWVKNCLRVQEGSEEDPTGHVFATLKGDYLKVWFAQFLRHPWTYIKGFFECSYSYYYPEERTYTEGLGFYEWTGYTFTQSMSSAHQIESLAIVRFLLEQLSKLEFVPAIGILYRCGFYTWLVLFAVAYLFEKKRYTELIITIPATVNILVCLVSPVNSCVRYALPTMCMIPILMCVMWRTE